MDCAINQQVIAITINLIKIIKAVSDTKTFVIPDGNTGTNSGSFDASTLLAFMSSNGGFGNGNWLWIVFLFFLAPLMRNGGLFGNLGGTGELGNMMNNDVGRSYLMDAINNTNDGIKNLATMLNTSTSNIQQAICQLNSAIGNVGSQVGLTAQQIINSIKQGNMTIGQQMANCCCILRESITKGFGDLGYTIADKSCQINQNILAQTQALKDASRVETNAIISRLDGMEKSALNDRIRSRDRDYERDDDDKYYDEERIRRSDRRRSRY